MSNTPVDPVFGPPSDPPDPAGGTSSIRYDQVTFMPDDAMGTQIFLNLEGGWKRTVGLQPDVNKATVSYVEFAKFGGNADRTGTVQFWYTHPAGTGQPDVAIKGERIVSVESAEQGEIPGGSVVTVEYRLFFADDLRSQFVEPRGGRLELGLLNAGTKFPSGGTGVPGAVAAGLAGGIESASTVPEATLRDLINACLGKMGLKGTDLPDSVDAAAAPRDIKWFGNHAPSELDKLLGLCGCVFCLDLNSVVTIEQRTDKGSPTLPAGEELPVQSVPKIDRRGKVVVFCSYPQRVIKTKTDNGPDPSTWYFVVRDSNDEWQPLTSCDLITDAIKALGAAGAAPAGVDPAIALVRDGFTTVKEAFRDRVTKELYRCIQCNQDVPCSIAPVLSRRFEKDLKDYPIQVLAKIARPTGPGIWGNSADQVEVAVQIIEQPDVLKVEFPLCVISGGTNDPNLYCSGSAGFSVRFSFEAYQDLSAELEGQNVTIHASKYFLVGFSAGGAGGDVAPLGESDCENAIDGNTKDAILLTRPGMRLINVDGQDANRDDLTAKAKGEASLWLADATQPARICAARGFAPLSPSGLIHEVEWDQRASKTTAKLADWYSPAGAMLQAHELRKLMTESLNV